VGQWNANFTVRPMSAAVAAVIHLHYLHCASIKKNSAIFLDGTNKLRSFVIFLNESPAAFRLLVPHETFLVTFLFAYLILRPFLGIGNMSVPTADSADIAARGLCKHDVSEEKMREQLN